MWMMLLHLHVNLNAMMIINLLDYKKWNGSGSTLLEVKLASVSTRPWVNSARCIIRAFSYVYGIWFVLYMYNLSD